MSIIFAKTNYQSVFMHTIPFIKYKKHKIYYYLLRKCIKCNKIKSSECWNVSSKSQNVKVECLRRMRCLQSLMSVCAPSV